MTAPVIVLRDAIFDRLNVPSAGYVTARKTPVPQLQPGDLLSKLPALSVFVMTGVSVPWGDGNVGPIKMVDDDTIGISIVRGRDDQAVLEGTIADELEAIKDTLFRDPTFVTFGAGSMFDSIERVTRRWIMPEDGEAYFIEGRLEITFRGITQFQPRVPDDFLRTHVTYTPADQVGDEQRTEIGREWTEEQNP